MFENIKRFTDKGTINAVKLLNKIDNYNGYIKLYSEIDSHIELNDIVYITFYGNNDDIDFDNDVILDNNILAEYSDEFIYNEYICGYKVIYVNKYDNSFVINKKYNTIPKNKNLYNHFVSKITINNCEIANSKINSTLIKNSNIKSENNKITELIQAVILKSELNNIVLIDKYNSSYLSLKIKYNEDTNTISKQYTVNNDNNGYTYVFDSENSIIDTDISNGNFYRCTFKNLSSDTKKINNGYFEECSFIKYEINNGYFVNTTNLSDDCVWNNGSWDGGLFNLAVWNNGNFINGIFGTDEKKNKWFNGNFYNGTFKGIIWNNGIFYNGNFIGTAYVSSNTGQKVVTQWNNGTFKGGSMKPQYFNHLIWLNGEILNGEFEHITFNGGKIHNGIFYNCSFKNVDVFNGVFRTMKKTIKSFNIFTNCNIYNGIFNGDWFGVKYDILNGIIYNKGNNEICDSIIYDGKFNYTIFYNNNNIKNGEFNSCFFRSPINIYGGKFYSDNKKIFVLDFLNETYNIYNNSIKSSSVSVSRCVVKSKKLIDKTDNSIKTKILLEFFSGHNFKFDEYNDDSNKYVILKGFNSIELKDKSVKIIEKNKYYDLSKIIYDGNNISYEYALPISNNYIIIDEDYKSWMFNDIGIVSSIEWIDGYTNNSITPSNDYHNIYYGEFKYANLFGNINVYNGKFYKSKMQNGIKFYNGVFKYGSFKSTDQNDDENEWYNGVFYNGEFGNNIHGLVKETRISIFNDKCEIDNSINGQVSSDKYLLTGVYPVIYQYVSKNLGVSAFYVENNNTINSEYVRNVIDDTAKKYMNAEVWTKNYIYDEDDFKIGKKVICPYEFAFRISCTTEDDLNSLKRILDYVNTNNNYKISIIDPNLIEEYTKIVDEDSGLSYDTYRYKTFKELFDMDYDYVSYTIEKNNQNNIFNIYVIFRFNRIKELYDKCTIEERNEFINNFRNVWSIVNSGYYTYPMPVLNEETSSNNNYGKDDLSKVGNLVFLLNDGTYVENTKWIYGTIFPLWWLSYNNGKYSIDWNKVMLELSIDPQAYDIDFIGTIKNNFNETILNNNSPCEAFSISKDDIVSEIRKSFNEILNDVNDLSNTTYEKPFSRRITDWFYYYIHKQKNKTGYDFSQSGVSFRNVYDNENILNYNFNYVNDFYNENFFELENLLYNSTHFSCIMTTNKIYFDNSIILNNFFNTGDKIFVEFNLFGTRSSSSLPPFGGFGGNMNMNAFDDERTGFFTITSIYPYSYNSSNNNYIEVSSNDPSFDFTSINNTSVSVYVLNKGLVMPYYYYVGKNNVYNIVSRCNQETFSKMLPYNQTLSSMYNTDEYNPNTKPFVSLSYKSYGERLGIRMQPIFHNYYMNSGFTATISGTTNEVKYFTHRNTYYCKMYKNQSTNRYRLEFIDVMPYTINPTDVLIDYNGNRLININIIGNKTILLNPDNIKSNWRYIENSNNWISLSYYTDETINNYIKGTWRVSSSGITNGNFYVEITDSDFINKTQNLNIGSYINVHVGTEPTVSCYGKLVEILYKDQNNNVKKIKTRILDYDFVNKAYIFDVSPSDVYIDAVDVWLSSTIKTSNIFNISVNLDDNIAIPFSDLNLYYNLQHFSDYPPYNILNSKIKIKSPFKKLIYKVNKGKEYLLDIILKYKEIQNYTPISNVIIRSDNQNKNIVESIIYDNEIDKFIFKDISKTNDNIKYQTSKHSNYLSYNWQPTNINDFEVKSIITPDVLFNNNRLYERLYFIRSMSNNQENIIYNDDLLIEFNYNNTFRMNILNISLKEKCSHGTFKNLYPNYYIDENDGIKAFGIPQTTSKHSQNRIFYFMKNIVGNNLILDLAWYYGDKNCSDIKNFQDVVLFSLYYMYKLGKILNYSIFNINNVFMKYLLDDLYNNNSNNKPRYVEYLTNEKLNYFKEINKHYQTSVLNFNKRCGIEIYSRNVTSNLSDFKDIWYNGEFNGNKFEGKWNGGKFAYGEWFGYNLTNPNEPFIKPSLLSISNKSNNLYEFNINLLKSLKRYFEYLPWLKNNNK